MKQDRAQADVAFDGPICRAPLRRFEPADDSAVLADGRPAGRSKILHAGLFGPQESLARATVGPGQPRHPGAGPVNVVGGSPGQVTHRIPGRQFDGVDRPAIGFPHDNGNPDTVVILHIRYDGLAIAGKIRV